MVSVRGLLNASARSETGPWWAPSGQDAVTVCCSTNPEFLASFANYYVGNGAVISGQFGDTRADTAAKATLTRLFPGRVIEQLNIDRLGTGGGGIHCVTQQQPVP
ncbi:agmatine deiminase family protein [Streptomyces sp. SID13666]|uniref:agmatine deiminase family protein n=1 Tax=Streptomyces sp. SID13588 TaxID=2706051 RepID=UPI0013BF5041|nr:agmatine deiminase family protein [Streptomyces sp. SID13666]NEA70295.1 agmatine deiminase family protein [Streptomyces sp. SID13588]